MKKAALRTAYRAKRLALSPSIRREYTEKMKTQLMDFLQGRSISVLMSYVPMEQMGEIDTAIFEHALQDLFPTLTIVYPKVEGNEMSAVIPLDNTDFTFSNIGVREHKKYINIPPQDIDLILVPLLAIDEKGYRVGYGKGFYDRFLLQTNALTIGLSFFEPIPAIEDTHTSDMAVQYCLCPNGIIAF